MEAVGGVRNPCRGRAPVLSWPASCRLVDLVENRDGTGDRQNPPLTGGTTTFTFLRVGCTLCGTSSEHPFVPIPIYRMRPCRPVVHQQVVKLPTQTSNVTHPARSITPGGVMVTQNPRGPCCRSLAERSSEVKGDLCGLQGRHLFPCQRESDSW